MKSPKSNCPQNLFLEVLGDKWTLLIIRDMMLNDKQYFREFLQSKEKIASNILSNRLQSLEKEGAIHKKQDPNHKQKIIYLLTQKGIDLFPILLENAKWSLKYKSIDKEDEKVLNTILEDEEEQKKSIMNRLEKKHLNQS